MSRFTICANFVRISIVFQLEIVYKLRHQQIEYHSSHYLHTMKIFLLDYDWNRRTYCIMINKNTLKAPKSSENNT